MLLQRGQGRILSGFFRVFSCEMLVSLWSPAFEGLGGSGSFPTDGVLGLSHDVSGSFNSSRVWREGSFSCRFAVSLLSDGV